MKNVFKKVVSISLAAVLSLSMTIPSYAQTKEEVKEAISQLQSEQKSLKSELADLKEDKSDTEEYIAELDKKIQKYVTKLENVSEDLNETQAEIEVTQESLAEAKENEKVQYTALKARIKAMYESGSTDYVQVLLGSGDLKSLLNESEYISKVNIYDNNLLDSLKKIKQQIADYEAELEEQQDLEEAQQEEYQLEMDSLTEIVSDKEDELVKIGEDIDDVSTSISDTADQIEAENAALAKIVAAEKKAAEEAAKKKAAEEAAAKAAAAKAAAAKKAAAASSSSSSSSGSSSGSTSTRTSSTSMIWPTSSTYISSYFGYRDSPTAGATTYHQGLDIGASYGDAIWAAASGTVDTVAYNSAMGNYVIINHGNGVCTVYEHCSATYVSAGQSVSQGETIAAVGSTGVSTGAHLHFGVSVGGTYVNPLLYVSP